MNEGGRRRGEWGVKRKRRSLIACASFPPPPSPFPTPSAFTLLEVILALGVLAAAVAVIGEVSRLSHRNAQRAALEGKAVLVGESVMAMLLAGLVEPVQIPETEWIEGQQQPEWRYALEIEPTDRPELLLARVKVIEITAEAKPITVELVRWILDPNEVGE